MPCLFVLYFRCASRGAGFAKRYYGSRHYCGAVSCCLGRFCFYATLLPLLEGDVPLEASNIALRQGPAFLSLMLKKLQPLLLLRLEGFCLPNGAVFRCHIFWSVFTFSCDWLGGVATGSRIYPSCPVCDWLRCRRLVGRAPFTEVIENLK